MIRRMVRKDVPDVVDIHLASFPGFFLTFLGPRFLTHFYNGICAVPEGIAFVLLDSDAKPAGFVAGTSDPRGFYRRLLKRDWLRFSLASISAILRRPSIVPRIARAASHPSRNPAGSWVAGLYSIGVRPSVKGMGRGRELVAAFLDQARHRGCEKVFLTTDRDGNDAVNAFYRKMGFHVEREYITPEGRRMNEYWRDV